MKRFDYLLEYADSLSVVIQILQSPVGLYPCETTSGRSCLLHL